MMLSKIRPKYIYLNLFILTLLLQGCNAPDLEIQDAWIREPAPSPQSLAGFMLIKNNSNTPVSLTEAKAEGFDHVMLHQSINEKGMHSMTHAENVVISPHGEVKFEHGSYHLMLMGIHNVPELGDTIPITLVFDNDVEKIVSFVVKKSDE